MINIWLHTRIKYGKMKVTHVTTKPYKVAYIFLFLAITSSIYLEIMVNVVHAGNYYGLVQDWLYGPWFMIIIVNLEIAKICCLIEYNLHVTY